LAIVALAAWWQASAAEVFVCSPPFKTLQQNAFPIQSRGSLVLPHIRQSMLRRSSLFVSIVLLLSVSTTYGQQAPRDQAAVDILQQSLTAMGGAAAIGNITTLTLTGQFNSYLNGQTSTKSFTTGYKFDGTTVRFRRELTDGAGTSVFASGGDRAIFQTAKSQRHRFGKHVVRAGAPFEVPALALVLALNDPNCAMTFIAEKNSAPLHVRIVDRTDDVSRVVTRQDWYFDRTTLLPAWVAFRVPDVINPKIHAEAVSFFVSYQTVSNFLTPRQIRTEVDGTVDSDLTINSIQVNATLAQDFDMEGDN
jgi:hypothetical protein